MKKEQEEEKGESYHAKMLRSMIVCDEKNIGFHVLLSMHYIRRGSHFRAKT